jgi:hypothetical protein
MPNRSLFLSVVVVVGVALLPLPTEAGGIPFWSPIIDQDWGGCALGWGAVITVINNIISLALTIALVFVLPLSIAYAGFLYVINPISAEGRSKAKVAVTNAVVGIALALAAWMIISAVMSVLYNPTNWTESWKNLITGEGSVCLTTRSTSRAPESSARVSVGGQTPSGPVVQCTTSACSPTALLAAANFNQTEANVMSCIAQTESSGNSDQCNGNACGTFQIMLTLHKLVGPACGGTLDCPSLCRGNDGLAVQTPACQVCVAEAKDPVCNAQSAYNLFSEKGYAPWTSASDNPRSQACIDEFGTVEL